MMLVFTVAVTVVPILLFNLKFVFTLQSMETITLLMGLMDCWLMPIHPAKASEETLTSMRMNTGARIHQVMPLNCILMINASKNK